MLRYHLSKLFTAHAEKLIPGRTEFGDTAKENFNCNRNCYRDEIIKSVQSLFEKFDSGLSLDAENTGTGTATLKIKATRNYRGYDPVEFELSTECSDLLLAMGREAAFCLKQGNHQKIFYYGNSMVPDNSAQHLGMPRYIEQVIKLAHYFKDETFSALYEEKCRTTIENEPTPHP